jgi:hypothetical protein
MAEINESLANNMNFEELSQYGSTVQWATRFQEFALESTALSGKANQLDDVEFDLAAAKDKTLELRELLDTIYLQLSAGIGLGELTLQVKWDLKREVGR